MIPSILVVSLHLGLPTLSLWAATCFVGVPWKLSTSVEVSCYMAKLSDVWHDLFCQCCICLESPEHIFHLLRHILPLLLFPPYHCESCLVGFPHLFLQLLNLLFFVFGCSCWYNYLAIDAWTNGVKAGACAGFGSGVVPGARSWTRSGGGSGVWAKTGAIACWCCWGIHTGLVLIFCLNIYICYIGIHYMRWIIMMLNNLKSFRP